MERRLIVVAGPTASGKTALAIDLAKHFDAEIFSADARQFYRGMNIGTAKPSAQELQAIPHRFIDVLDPAQEYTAGKYARDLREALSSYYQRKTTALLVGGSGFYIKAALEGMDDLPDSPPKLRARWSQIYEQEGLEGLQQRVQDMDPSYYAIVDKNNPQRLQRALEAMEQTGQTFTALRKNQGDPLEAQVACLWLNPPREELYTRINCRVDHMMENGLLEEVKGFHEHKHLNALQTVGYRELFSYLDGDCDLAFAVDKIKQHTRNYAKRQITWFKKQENCQSIDQIKIESIIRHLEEALNV